MKILSLLLLSLLNLSLAQDGKIDEEFYVWDDSGSAYRLLHVHPEMIIDHRSDVGFELYAPSGTKKFLDQLGIRYISNPKAATKSIQADYPSYEENTRTLKQLASQYPDILKLETVGQSVQGRELWVMKISDNVTTDEVEPEFKYISTMHGDEITGRDVMVRFIKALAKSYGSDQRITNLINNTEIYIMPNMNPDGTRRRRRANANGYDLNRNFPHILGNSSSRNRQKETTLIMDWQNKRQFAFSANFHGGAEVINYPWDSTYDRHPFDSLVKKISLDYANRVSYLRNSRRFDNGITNGADWYVIRGSMQDWSYHFLNDLQITVEISSRKWPRYSQIDYYYRENEAAILHYIQAIHQGAGFKISNLQTDGSVEIKRAGVSLGTYHFRNSEFFKLLEVGEYQFEVTTDNGNTYSFPITVDSQIQPNGNYHTILL